MADDLVPALFALATVIAERLHDTAISGQNAGLDPANAGELTLRLKRHASEIDTLASAIEVVIANTDLTIDPAP